MSARDLTLTIDNWEEFKTAMLARRPVPKRPDGPVMSDDNWVEECIRNEVDQEHIKGKHQLKANEVVINDNMVTIKET